MKELIGEKFSCQTCKNVFYRASWAIKKGITKFCSLGCRRHTDEGKKNISIAKIGSIPWNKGTKGLTKKNRTSFKKGYVVSKERIDRLSQLWRGENHPNWKGGITPEVMRIRNSKEMKNWRKSVFERDNYSCVIGGKEHGNKLEADHIKPFSLYPELRFVVDNGRTLCVDCHKRIGWSLFRVNNPKKRFGAYSLNYTA